MPTKAQMSTRPYATSRLRSMVTVPITIATSTMMTAQVAADSPKPSHLRLTSSTVIFATVATVVQPK